MVIQVSTLTQRQWEEIEVRARGLNLSKGQLLHMASDAAGECIPALDPHRISTEAADSLLSDLREARWWLEAAMPAREREAAR